MSFGVSIAWAARINVLARTTPRVRSGRKKRAVTPSPRTSTSWTIAGATTCAPSFSAFATWTLASYLAPIGQMGTQVALPQQAGRPSHTLLFRACGLP
jgi:hypothetical protein